MVINILVDKKHWTNEEELLNYFAVGQCTPGVIAVNTATFIGYKRQRIWGAIFATAGVVLPSLLIISILAAVLSNFAHIEAVQHAFAGIRVAVGALITATIVRLVRGNIKNAFQISIAVLSFVFVAVLGQNPIFAVLGAALCGLFCGFFKKGKERKEKK